MTSNLTAGAERILQAAADLAGLQGRTTIGPLELLRALIADESRAHEILSARSITPAAVDQQWPAPAAPAGPSSSTKSSEAPTPDDTLQLVFQEARHRAGLAGRHAEVGSEHLLWGLLQVDSPVAEFLKHHGLDAASLGDDLAAQTGFETTPIQVDEALAVADPRAADRADAWRIIDAAANRCAEGVRVIEDVFRFSRDDRFLSGQLKSWRHAFGQAIKQLPAGTRLEMRDTPGDVGTRIETASERTRTSLNDLAAANFKRAQEALRSLEEASKLLGPSLAAFSRDAEALRYRLYTLEKTALRQLAGDRRLDDARLYLLATTDLCHPGVGPVIRESVARGVDIVQIREKDLADAPLLAHAQRVREWTREADALLIINDRPDIALLADADGVHLGQDDLSVREARRILGPGKLIGVSTHTIEQARQAVLDGADYLGVGPTFPSGTKSFDAFAGLEFIAQVAAEIDLPWFAIGGITAENLPEVLAAGGTRVAVSGAICRTDDPGGAAADLKRILDAPTGT